MFDGYDAIYTRQSLYKEDSLSIETQQDFAKRLCVREIRYYSDPGWSGKNTNRPGYKLLMKDIENHLVRRVLVYRMDRFSRSLLDFAEAWEYLAKYNVAFISVTESFDTSTPIGEAMVFIIMIFAQLERKQIAARVRDNYFKRLSLGRWPGGPAPYGFVNDKIMIEGTEVSTLSITDTMDIMEWMVDKYAEPLIPLSEIRKILNGKGIPGPKGIPWSTNTVARLLHSPVAVKMDLNVYAFYKQIGVEIASPIEAFTGEFGGLLITKKNGEPRKIKNLKETKLYVGNWPARIETAPWLKCQEKMKDNIQLGNNGRGSHTWLTGLMKCGYCGRALVVIAYKKRNGDSLRKYLRCSGRNQEMCDKIIQFKVEELEDEVQDQLERLLKSCKSIPIDMPKSNFEEQKELITIDEKIDNLIKVLSSGEATGLTIKHVNHELEKLTIRKEELEQILIPENKPVTLPDKINFNELSFEDKKVVANSWIDKVFIFDDHLRIKWKV